MNEIIKALMDAGCDDAFESLAAFTDAAKGLGYTEDEANKALDEFGGSPLDDDDLEGIAGGYQMFIGFKANPYASEYLF